LEACVSRNGAPQNHYALALLYKRMGEETLARKELAVRQVLLRDMSEETASGLSALQAFTASLTNPDQ
jgi:hypothetical protein